MPNRRRVPLRSTYLTAMVTYSSSIAPTPRRGPSADLTTTFGTTMAANSARSTSVALMKKRRSGVSTKGEETKCVCVHMYEVHQYTSRRRPYKSQQIEESNAGTHDEER